MGELSGEPGVRWEPTSTELMDRLGLNSDGFREKFVLAEVTVMFPGASVMLRTKNMLRVLWGSLM